MPCRRAPYARYTHSRCTSRIQIQVSQPMLSKLMLAATVLEDKPCSARQGCFLVTGRKSKPTVARLQGGTPVSFANTPMSIMYIFFPAQASSFPAVFAASAATIERHRRPSHVLPCLLRVCRAPAAIYR